MLFGQRPIGFELLMNLLVLFDIERMQSFQATQINQISRRINDIDLEWEFRLRSSITLLLRGLGCGRLRHRTDGLTDRKTSNLKIYARAIDVDEPSHNRQHEYRDDD